MNIKLLLTSLSIILINVLLGLFVLQSLHMPYKSTMFLFTVFSILLWFFFLRKDVPITIKAINKDVRNNTLALLLIPIGVSIFTLTTTSSIDYGVIGFLFVTSFLIAMYEEVLFRAIGLGSFISSGMSPAKAILLSSLIFAIAHMMFLSALTWGSVSLLLNSFAMGFILGYIYFLTRNIVYIIAIHFIWDIAIFMNQRIANQDTGFVVTIVLFILTIWYFIWSVKGVRKL